jgi:hypothetical protein
LVSVSSGDFARSGRRLASSISRAGIRKRPAAITENERVGHRIWSTTLGGRARRLGRFPGFTRWRRTRSTRPTFSTAITWS